MCAQQRARPKLALGCASGCDSVRNAPKTTRAVPAIIVTNGAQVKTSVIVVNYRAYRDLAACLASVERLSRRPAETIVVDQDAVPDEAWAVARRFPGVSLIQTTENKGFGDGVNLGASHATGDALLVLNPDCVLGTDLLAKLEDWLDAHSPAGAVGPAICDPDGTRQASARRFPDWTTGVAGRQSWLTRTFPNNVLSRRNLLTHPIRSQPVQVDWVSGACVLLRRAAFDAVGGFDARFFLYWEDADLCRRLLDAGWQTWHHPGASATHTVARSSRTMPVRATVAFHASAFRYQWKHGSALARALAPVPAGLLAARCAALLAVEALRQLGPAREATDE